MQNARILSEVSEFGGKRTQREALICAIIHKVEEKVYDECICNEYVIVRIDLKSGTIEVHMNRKGENFVDISHDRNTHESPLIAEAIEKALPNWQDIEAQAEVEEESELRNRNYLRQNSRYW